MRELRSCDFCGVDAVGTFAIVPPELEPTEAEQRRVVCCDDCKDRLEGLLEPLLARAGLEAGAADTDATTSDGDTAVDNDKSETETVEQRGEPTADADGDGGTVIASSDESTQKRQRTSSPNATVSEAGSGSDGDGTGDDRDQGSELEDGITVERAATEDGNGSSEGGSTETGSSNGDSSGTHESDDSTTHVYSSGSELSDGETASQSSSRPPKAYGKVLRLLQNREFPMQRSAVSNLAAGAYDLESHEVDAIIDHALESGEFTEKGGKLHRS